jgi:hypothetical protein
MDLGIVAQLGVAAFAILVMWWIVSNNSEERKRHDAEMAEERKSHLDALREKEHAFRQLESDIRNKFSTQMMENTNAMLEHSKIMRQVAELLADKKR